MTYDDTPHANPAHLSPDMAKKQAAGFAQFSDRVSTRNVLFQTSDDLPRVIEVALAEIDLNPDQPRKTFDEASLRELADSIAEHGLIQPVTVAQSAGDRYTLVAGERRLRAHQLLSRDTIAAIVTTGEPDVIALIENIQREALDPLEEAAAYEQMMERHGYSQTELGRIVGKKQNTISEALSLSRLSPAVVDAYRTSDTRLSKNVLVEIAKEADETRQLELAQSALSDRLGVRAVRARRKSPSPPPSNPTQSTEARAAGARKNRLIRSLAATVKRLGDDGRAEDFPAGSEALSRVTELRDQLNEHLDRITRQPRMGDE